MEIEQNDVLRVNEVLANKFSAIVLGTIFLLYVAIIGISQFDYFYIKNLDYIFVRVIYATAMVLTILGIALAKHFNFDKPWLKYMLISDVIFGVFVLDVIYTINVTIMIVVPVVLSGRYFSRRYTLGVTIVSFFVFCLSSILGVYYGVPNPDVLMLPKNSTINMGPTEYLVDAMAEGYIPYEKSQMLVDTLMGVFFPEVLQAAILALISYLIADYGRRMVYKQEKLTENTARVGAELALATKIQADVLPSLFPAFPQRHEFDLFASMNPAKEVGGDFYDFFLVDNDHLALVIADVSGKGVPAAMFMMASKNIIATKAMLGNSPAETLRQANESICATNSEDMFVTVWLGIVTISTGHMVCASAGHEYPVLKQGDGGFELLKDKHGMPVGFIDIAEYEEYEIQFEPGDKLFVYTDGVPEATRDDKQMYGTDRIVEALNRDVDASCEQMLTNIWNDVGSFIDGADQFDDLTMLSFEYRGLQ